MELAGALDLVELRFDAGDALLDHAPIRFDLRLARTAEKAEAAALALEMRPGTHQPAFLVGEMRQLDLQRALAGAGAAAENLQYQPGAVQYFRAPGLLEIALLHRRERAVHHHDPGFLSFDEASELLDLALANEGSRTDVGERHDAGRCDAEVDGACEAHRLLESRLRGAERSHRARIRPARGAAAQMRLDHDRAARFRACARAQAIAAAIEPTWFQSGLFPGRQLLGPFEQLDRMTRHDRGDGVLVDQLRVPISSQ